MQQKELQMHSCVSLQDFASVPSLLEETAKNEHLFLGHQIGRKMSTYLPQANNFRNSRFFFSKQMYVLFSALFLSLSSFRSPVRDNWVPKIGCGSIGCGTTGCGTTGCGTTGCGQLGADNWELRQLGAIFFVRFFRFWSQ